jgi:general secretion pathway protein D
VIRLRHSTRAQCAAIAILLSGCAAQTAYKEGQQLLAQGKTSEAVQRLEEARRLDPAATQYRMALTQAREQQRNDALDQARLAQRQAALVAPPPPVASAAPPAPATPPELSAAYRKLITIEFKDAPLRHVFDVIARTSGLNFLFDKDVRTDQKTSIFLKNSTIENAVNLTLLTNQLGQRVLDANTVLVYPNTQAKQRDYQPLNVKSFYLANADAKTVAATLKAMLKTRDIVVDDKLNLVIMRDSAEAIRMAEKLVALHDVAEPEVMLEVEILEVKRTRLLDLGIRWPDQLSLAPIAGATGGALTLDQLRGLSSSTTAATVGPVSISAKKTDTDANILANPRIRARNREKAKILIGERVPNITATSTSTGFVAESVTYVDVGLKLDVEPTVYMDGDVAIKIALEVSNIIGQLQTKSGSAAYQIGTRTAQTVLRLKDGETQVLAGLINDEDRRSANKVPGFGEVPVIGRLFGNQADDASKTEIVLSITPRVLRNVVRPQGHLMEFESGTESSLGNRATMAGGTAQVSGSAAALPAPAGPTRAPSAGPSSSPSAAPPASSAGSAPVADTTPTPAQPAASSGPTALRWQGPNQLRVGDTFALQLHVQPGQPVMSVPLAVAYDAKTLQVVSVTEGDFLRQGGAQASFTSRVDPNGQVLLTATRAGGAGASAPGALATFNFRVIAAASPETRVQVLTAAPLGADGRPVPTPLPPPHVIRLGSGTSEQQPPLQLRPALALSLPAPAPGGPFAGPATPAVAQAGPTSP